MKYLFKNKLFKLLVAGGLLVFVANIFSPTPMIALFGTYSRGFGMITQLFLFAFTIYCAYVLSKQTISKSLKIIFVSGLLVAFYAILQKFGFDPLFNNFDTDLFVGRVFSSLGNPGYLGQFIMLVLLIGVYLLATSKNVLFKAIYGLGSLICLVTLLLSQTRASILTLLVCFVIIAIRYRSTILKYFKKIKKTLKTIVVLSIIPILIIIGVVSQQDRFSLNKIGFRSMNSRIETWKGTLELIQRRPILGYGAETIYVYAPEIITKEFLTLEEDISLNIDRVHNEFLEIIFSYGIYAGFIYIAFLLMLFGYFLRSKEPLIVLLSLLIIGNSIQNQLAFPDISISILISFCIGGIIALQEKKKNAINMKFPLKYKHLIASILLFVFVFSFINVIYKPFMSQLAYARSKANYSTSWAISVDEHKTALFYTPYYSKLWYELIFIDPASLETALYYLEKIEGESGNVLAWKGNLYSDSDPAKSSEYHLRSLEKNPYYPNWIRAYADMLYKNGDYEGALYLYKQYLEAVPDFWKWGDSVYDMSSEEQKSYRIFFKNVPDFWITVERVMIIESIMAEEE